MPDPVDVNTIEQLARAVFGALAPITGHRATGTVRFSALAGAAPVQVPKNTYLRPVVGGALREDLLFKTTADFTIAAGTIEDGLPITSNLGGARHNLAAGTVFRFDPVPAGLGMNAVLGAPMTDGSDAGSLLRSLSFFEDLDASNPSADIFAAMVSVPGLMLTWQRSEPAEGAMAGLGQGQNRASRSAKFFREYFVAYVVVGRLESDPARRKQGLLISIAVSRLLTDRMMNDDGESLSSVGGGVDVTSRARYRRDENRLIYAIAFRVNQTLEKAPDTRFFSPWERTRFRGSLPGNEAPEPTAPIEIVDDTEDMP